MVSRKYLIILFIPLMMLFFENCVEHHHHEDGRVCVEHGNEASDEDEGSGESTLCVSHESFLISHIAAIQPQLALCSSILLLPLPVETICETFCDDVPEKEWTDAPPDFHGLRAPPVFFS